MIMEEEIRNGEDNNFGVTILKSYNFEDVWSSNHPHLSVKKCREKLCQVEVLVEKRTFQAFQEKEHDDYIYALELNLLQVWEYTKAK